MMSTHNKWVAITIAVLTVIAFSSLAAYAAGSEQGDQGVVDLGYHYLALPDTLTLAANPSVIAANGLSTTTLTATLTEAGNPVPDGTQVVFTTTHGHLTNWDTVYTTTTTTSGVATATLTSVPSSSDVTATVQATSGGVSDDEAVTFQVITCQSNFTDWAEYSSNPILDPPGNTIVWSNAAGLYDRDQFSGHGLAAPYKIWFSNGGGSVSLITSTNGIDWTSYEDALVASGLTRPDHPVVKYYADGFTGLNTGTNPSGMTMYYRIWYWPQGPIYTIDAIHYAESPDGVVWYNDQALTQDATQPLVTGVASRGWNRGTYGPVDVLYNPSATNSGTNPFDYSFAMYYGGTDGGREVTGLAYSVNGTHWTRYGDGPVVDHGPDGAWDSNDAVYGSVIKDSNGVYHYWYGGSQDLAYHGGIGYAVSADGIHWAKSLDNPILHHSDGESWRAEWTHTPFVLFSSTRFDGHGSPEQYKMWFSGRDVSQKIPGEDAIGYATLNSVSLSLADTSGSGQSGQVGNALSQPFVVGLRDKCGMPASDVPVTFTISGTPAGASGQSLSVVSGKTNAAGQILTTLTLGDKPGVYTVTADAAGVLGIPAVFTAIADIAPVLPSGGIYLPIIMNNHVPAPDLVVDDIIITNPGGVASIQVVVRNQGDAVASDEFWVDFYIDPNPPPSGVNQTWSYPPGRCAEGLVWGVVASALPIMPGDTLTLTYGGAYYDPSRSNFSGSFTAGAHNIYAQVDSANANTTYGAVRENHEITGGAYNNIRGEALNVAASAGAASPPPVVEGKTAETLPPRPGP